MAEKNTLIIEDARSYDKLLLLGRSLLVGVAAGLVTAAYRFVLTRTEGFLFDFYGALGGHPGEIALVFLFLAAAGLAIGLLVRRFPQISGSGVPQVKDSIFGPADFPWLSTLTTKFAGGALCILGGLSLGRAGPSVQLGACVGQGLGEKLTRSRTQQKILIASGAAAGLAAAFNAPLAGVMFTLEEVFRYFSPMVLLSAMTAAIAADFTAGFLFGMEPLFHFTVETVIPLENYWFLALMGLFLGVAGAFYNWCLLAFQRLYRRLPLLPAWARPVIPFLLAGVLGLCFPWVLGGGQLMVGRLSPEAGLGVLLLLLAAKFLFSMISYGSGAPGGIFFPLLILGSAIGAVFGHMAVFWLGWETSLFYNCIILAMAGYFTAIIRAPITAILLTMEVTGSLLQLLPLAVVSLSAYAAADLLKSPPIYDSLRANSRAAD